VTLVVRRRVLAGVTCGVVVLSGLALVPVSGGPHAAAALSVPGARSVDGRPLAAGDPAEAAALAAATGEPVAILPDETDFSQTFAEPDGGFVDSESLVPQRVEEPDGSWVPIDTTLSVQPGGLVAPGAITTGLTLSDGGPGPLFTLSQGRASLSVSWPFGSLPLPALSGATATYSGVLPGVNLLVSATPTGVSEVLEITSAMAAANPDLAQITFPMSETGVTLSAGAGGNLTASDDTGSPVFTAPAAQMWDSAGEQPSAATTVAGQVGSGGVTSIPAGALGPVPGDAQAVMGVSATTGSMSLTPVASVLSGSSVVYPVFIDPTWNSSESSSNPSWSDVFENLVGGQVTGYGSDWEPSSQYGGIRSGVTCDDSDQSTGDCDSGTTYQIYRAFLNFPTPSDQSFKGATWASAWLQLNESYAWGCEATAKVTMYDTDSSGGNVPSNTSTTWQNQPAPGDWLASNAQAFGYSSNCPAADIYLQAGQAAQAAANGSWPWLTLRLSATSQDEADLNQWSWKNFQAAGGQGMVLNIAWRNAPSAPATYGTQGAFNAQTGENDSYDCQPDNSPTPDYVGGNDTTWQAAVSDPDGGSAGNLDGEFTWSNVSTGTTPATIDADQNKGGGLRSGSLFTVSRTGAPGDQYKWQAYGTTLSGAADGNPDGETYPRLEGNANFPWCYFTIDAGSPEAPQISTTWTSSDPIGSQGQFTFSEPAGYKTSYTTGPLAGQNDVVGYLYGIDNSDPSVYVPASSMGGSATVFITPFTLSEIDLYVQAVGAGGNVSNWGGNANAPGLTEYKIDTAPAPGNVAVLGWWQLNNNGDVNFSSGDNSEDLSLLGNSGFGCTGQDQASPPGYTCSLSLPGSAGHAATRPVLGNDGSFSVSAWANPSGCEQVYCAVLSQGGYEIQGQDQADSAFTIGYQATGSAGSSASPAVRCPCWLFSMPKTDQADEYDPTDPTGSGWYVAAVPAGSVAGTWTQLTGVFDASHGELELYVNGGDVGQSGGQAGDGNPAATASASPWSAAGTGDFRIGADWTQQGGVADYFDGSVSDVCAFYGVLEQSDVQSLYTGTHSDPDGCAVVDAEHQPS
jgi:hypothetical protein